MTDNEEGGEGESGLRSDWAEMTHECLTNILSRLTLEDRWKGPMLVCKSWMRAFRDRSLHFSFDLDPQFGSAFESARWWSPDFERKIDSMLRSVINWSDGSLTEIRTRHCSDRSLSFVAERCPNLQILSIKSCPNVTDASITQIAFGCPNLMEVDISYCYEISHESLATIGKNCPSLEVLKRNFMNWLDPSQHVGIVPGEYLNACPQDGDTEASAIGKFMPNLKHLELRFSKLSAKGLALICEGCPNLEYLDLAGCANLTSRDIVNSSSNLKNLKEIKKPNFYIPRSVFHTERYGHWRLYDERFQTDVFRI
ncbi:F-box protein SKIP1 [Tripterygium wilfordii]|uniref:F-box protein SKIP1 n=1 Tax=Tripterygium wilfordii TaxID=458696 RepID=A0A7J7DT10_TRIWF|nr:F-box protein SKIP1-like [Tripterygium wilfordii]KAF5749500.1 F-box protein SKIP1 [Tripterygium wilfordii]